MIFKIYILYSEILRSLNLSTLGYNDRDHLNILRNNNNNRPCNLFFTNFPNLKRLYKLPF